MKFIRLSIFFVLTFFLFSCKTKTDNIKTTYFSDTLVKQYSKYKVYEQYQLPLPIEIFEQIRDKYNYSSICLADKYNKVILQSWQQAIILGVYTADIAYNAEYYLSTEVIKYSQLCSKISDELSIKSSYGLQLINRLESNITNKDSIIFITNNAYYETCKNLDEQQKNNILPFVVFGGWLETLNILAKCSITDTTIINMAMGNIDKLINFLNDAKIETSAYHFQKEIDNIIASLERLNKKYHKNKEQGTINKINLFDELEKIRKDILF